MVPDLATSMTETHRRRAHVHLPPAQGCSVLHGGAGAGRGHPPRHRTQRPLQRHSPIPQVGDRRSEGLREGGGEGRRRQQASTSLRPEQRNSRQRSDRHDHVPPHRARPGVRLPAGAAERLRGPPGHPRRPAEGHVPACHRAVQDSLSHPGADRNGGLPTLPGRLELVRNPHFREWSPAAQPAGYPDRIVLKTGYTAEQAVAQVADGRADLVFDGVASADVERLGTRYSSQLHTSPGVYTGYLYLNTATPPFDDVDARRACRLCSRPASAQTPRGAARRQSPASSSHPTLPPTGSTARSPSPVARTGSGRHRMSTGPTPSSGSREPAGPRSWCSPGTPRNRGPWSSGPWTSSGALVTESLCARCGCRPLDYATTHRHRWNLGLDELGSRLPAAVDVPRAPSAHVTWSLQPLAILRQGGRQADQGGAPAAGHRPRVGQRRLEPHRPRGCRRGSGDPVRQQPAAGLRQSPGRQHPRASAHRRPAHRPDVGPMMSG